MHHCQQAVSPITTTCRRLDSLGQHRTPASRRHPRGISNKEGQQTYLGRMDGWIRAAIVKEEIPVRDPQYRFGTIS